MGSYVYSKGEGAASSPLTRNDSTQKKKEKELMTEVFMYLGRPIDARLCPIIGLVILPKVAVSDSGAGDLLTTPALLLSS